MAARCTRFWILTTLGAFVATTAWAATSAGEGGYGPFTFLFLFFGAVFTVAQIIPPLVIFGMGAATYVLKRRGPQSKPWMRKAA